jgi:hypothetical protein
LDNVVIKAFEWRLGYPVFRVLRLIGWGRRRSSDGGQQRSNSNLQRRLFLLGTAFMARGMKPEDAYNKALYYTKGPGRRQNWMSALAEQDREMHVSAE